ncbi:hypothetical protein [Microtetraspora malaysiensis]|uniref:hypothetical protein n=1 Tax=Microtetraspora malaysiensis TaxID=161358 RepID=UPI003D93CEAC
MRELVGRLAALDPDAGAAVQVIAYFDRLVESRAGLEAIVRGAAVLAGCPARLVDGERRVRVRVLADGRREDVGTPRTRRGPARRCRAPGRELCGWNAQVPPGRSTPWCSNGPPWRPGTSWTGLAAGRRAGGRVTIPR